MWPASEETPKSVCPAAGVQEETAASRKGRGRKVPAQLPRGGRPARERPLWVGGSSLSVSNKRLKGKGSPRPMYASFWHTGPRRIGLLLSSLTILQSQLEKQRKNNPLVLGDLAS